MTEFTHDDLKAARDWLADVYADCPCTLSDADVVAAIDKGYAGGWAGFVKDGEG